MSFADTLKMIMAQRNMKSVELSRTSGLSESIISEYLSGKKEPRGRQSIEIARALGVSLDELWETGFSPESSWDIADHIKKYRLLNEDGQQRLDSTLDDLLKIDQYRKDHLQPDLGEIIERAEQKHAAKAKLVAKGGFKKYKEAPSDDEIEEIIRRADENERKKRS